MTVAGATAGAMGAASASPFPSVAMASPLARFRRTILATCCVPWHEDGSLAEEVFRRSVWLLAGRGLRDLYVFGTAGEGYAVTDSQFDAVVRAFADEARGAGVTPMVGVISLSLPTIIERIARAAGQGVREFQVSLPSWGTLNAAELQTFFREVCGRFPELHFLHYNLPRAGRILTPGEYARLVETHPNLVATKFGGADLRLIAEFLAKVPQLRHFYTELGFLHGSLIGEPGLLASGSVIDPQRARAFFDAGVARDTERLLALYDEIAAIRELMLVASEPELHIDGARDKLYSKLLDPQFPLRLLPPYQAPSDAAFERFRASMRERFPHWLADAARSGA